MIGKKLNPNGVSLVDVFIPRPTPEESEKFYKDCYKQVMDVIYPELTGYLQSQEIDKKCHKCETREELEALTFEQVPPNIFQRMIELLNGIKEMNDTERLFALAQMGDRLVFSATQYVEKIMRERYQVIMMLPKGPKIINPTSPRFADKIINPYE